MNIFWPVVIITSPPSPPPQKKTPRKQLEYFSVPDRVCGNYTIFMAVFGGYNDLSYQKKYIFLYSPKVALFCVKIVLSVTVPLISLKLVHYR